MLKKTVKRHVEFLVYHYLVDLSNQSCNRMVISYTSTINFTFNNWAQVGFKKRELIIYKQRNSKKYFSNYRTCMGMLLQRMYGLHIQIIANFSATQDLIQKTKMTVLISEIQEYFSRNILIKGLISEQPYTNYQII